MYKSGPVNDSNVFPFQLIEVIKWNKSLLNSYIIYSVIQKMDAISICFISWTICCILIL